MRSALSVLTLVVPELVGLVERRHAVLRAITEGHPVGRRSLADRLGWSERITRTEVELMREFGLVELGGGGVSLSSAGRQILRQLDEILAELQGLAELEQKLASTFALRRAIVVPGDGDADPASRDALARRACEQILQVLGPTDVIAVSGGSTLAAVARRLSGRPGYTGVTVVPTGGGLGDTLEIEANTVAAQLARALGARCRLLHLPDDLAEQSVNALLEANSTIRDMFEVIRSADIVVQGVGTTGGVAERRHFSAERTSTLKRHGAVGESLGYFFDIAGGVVEAAGGVGMRLADLRHVAHVIVVAGGASKAQAIAALLNTGLQHVLVTDEAAARAIVSGAGGA